MELLRTTAVEARATFRLVLTLTDATVIERDVDELLNGPLRNRRESENEGFGVRARRETGGKVVTFVEDFATRPWRRKAVCRSRSVFLRAVQGQIYEPLRSDPDLFRQVYVDGGTVAWPNGADLCPDVVIWGGRPTASE